MECRKFPYIFANTDTLVPELRAKYFNFWNPGKHSTYLFWHSPQLIKQNAPNLNFIFCELQQLTLGFRILFLIIMLIIRIILIIYRRKKYSYISQQSYFINNFFIFTQTFIIKKSMIGQPYECANV